MHIVYRWERKKERDQKGEVVWIELNLLKIGTNERLMCKR
jgi:hypothetical protein